MDSRGDTDRWSRLVRLLKPIHAQAMATARRLCRSVQDGDDLYQETVLRAYDKLDGLRDEFRFRPWFYATLLSRHRSRVRRPRRESASLEDLVGRRNEPVGEDGTSWDEERRQAERAARALAGLPPVQRDAIVLHDIEEFPVEEIAEMQGVTPSAVKSRLSRGRERLRRFYERNGETGGAWASHAAPARAIAWPAEERSHE